MSMFGEVRKRHLLQIALVYLGAAWLFIEITDFAVGTYGFSRKILDTVLLLGILGFPAFLIIGWYHGETGRQRVQRGEMWLLATLITLAGVGTYRIATGEEVPAEVFEGVAPPGGPGLQPVSTEADLGARSLAVLPFKNNVPDDDLAWLGAGLADLLTTNFAQLPDMRVVGRQTLYDMLTEEGRSEEEEIPEALALTVARASGARMMLWGSITGTHEDMRIDAQLIELENGTLMFAEYARGNDVFALVDTLTMKLQRRLAGDRPPPPIMKISQVGTRDMEAFGAFQQGIAAERAGRLDEAETLFERAVTIDSTFVLPMARLAFRQGGSVGAVSTGEEQDVEWSFEAFDPDDAAFDPGDPDLEKLARASAVGWLTEKDLENIVVAAELDEAERLELSRRRAEYEQHAASFHRARAVRTLERMGVDLAVQFEGMSQEQVLAKLDSTMGRALSSVQVLLREMPRDSLGRPIPPPDDRRSPRPDGSP